MLENLIAHRRALHRIPELDDQLPKTRDYLLSQLARFRCRIIQPGHSAVLAFFDGGKPDTTAFRSDMDALPIREQTGLPFASAHPGQMHACGHDGHMAMLLCLAEYVDAHLDELPRNVLLVFQPAEETTGGARDICRTGIFQELRARHIFGIHLWPDLPAGVIGTRSGPMMARSSEVTVEILGKSAHIAKWQEGIDALAAGAEFIRRAYAMANTELPADWYQVFKFGRMESGTVRNAVSARTLLEGTLRTFQDEAFDHITRRAAEIGQELTKETGCQFSVRFSEGYPPVCNDPQLYAKAAALLGPDGFTPLAEPALIAEDFSFYQQVLPGLFFFLGVGGDQPLHSDRFCFDEKVLVQGVLLYQALLQL
ncbi:MAG: amidohydrolase [Oscillospiraceae bacterium]|nr:amidohydrolase [Oscillospiraceae bacterium]